MKHASETRNTRCTSQSTYDQCSGHVESNNSDDLESRSRGLLSSSHYGGGTRESERQELELNGSKRGIISIETQRRECFSAPHLFSPRLFAPTATPGPGTLFPLRLLFSAVFPLRALSVVPGGSHVRTNMNGHMNGDMNGHDDGQPPSGNNINSSHSSSSSMSSRPSWIGHDYRRKQSQDFRSDPLPQPGHFRSRWTRRPLLLVLLPLFCLVLLLFHYHQSPETSIVTAARDEIPLLPLHPKIDPPPPLGPYHPLRSLRGPPTELFRGEYLKNSMNVRGLY